MNKQVNITDSQVIKILDHLPTGIVIVDRAGTILYASQTAAVFFEIDETDKSTYEMDLKKWSFIRLTDDGIRKGAFPFYDVIETGISLENDLIKAINPANEKLLICYSITPQNFIGVKPQLFVISFKDISSLEQSLAISSESEARFQKAFQTNPDAINISRLSDGKYVDVNEGFTDNTGFSREEVIGKTSMEINIWADSSDRERMVAELSRDGKITNFESKFRMKDGSIITALLSASIIDLSGEPHIISITKNIDSLRKAEEELKAREKTLRTIFQAAPNGIGMVINREFQWINPRICEMTGYREDELIGKNARMVYESEEEFLRAGRVKYAAIEKAGIGSVETRFKQKDGGVIDILLSSSPLDENDLSQGVIFTVSDISNLKRTMADLHVAESRYQTVIEESNDAICVMYNSEIELINHRFTEIFGLTIYNIRESGFDLLHLISPESRKAFKAIIDSGQSQSLSSSRLEFSAVNKAKEEILLEVSFSEIPFYEGIGLQIIFRDVTKEKRLEDQLLQAQKMEAVGRLAGGVAHDFNNHLTAILGNASLALSSLDDIDELKEDLQEITGSAKRAAELVKQLLIISRKHAVETISFDLNELIGKIEQILTRLIGEDIEMVFNPAVNLIPILADPTQIEQVLMNLAVNSRDAMPKGGRIKIETENIYADQNYAGFSHDLKPGNYVQLSFSDTGAGIPEDIRDRIFEPFFTTKPAGQGTGLGLSTVYAIVKKFGGAVTLFSEAGQGTTFKIYLPGSHTSGREILDEDINDHSSGGSERILVVEDEESVRNAAVRILRLLGYQVFEAANGEQALQICIEQEEPVDLILSDVVMPEMDGHELGHQIRKIWPEVSFLFMSGYTREGLNQRGGGLESGVFYISKPFTPAKLNDEIRSILDVEK